MFGYYGFDGPEPMVREDFHRVHHRRVDDERRRAQRTALRNAARRARAPKGTQRRAQLHARAMAQGRV